MFFFFNDTATTEIYTLSLHDALPIYAIRETLGPRSGPADFARLFQALRIAVNQELEQIELALPALRAALQPGAPTRSARSEEHTSELQSQSNLVCRLLLEKKKKRKRR